MAGGPADRRNIREGRVVILLGLQPNVLNYIKIRKLEAGISGEGRSAQSDAPASRSHYVDVVRFSGGRREKRKRRKVTSGLFAGGLPFACTHPPPPPPTTSERAGGRPTHRLWANWGVVLLAVCARPQFQFARQGALRPENADGRAERPGNLVGRF